MTRSPERVLIQNVVCIDLYSVLTSCSVENVLETVKIGGGGSSLENRWLEKDHESEAGQRQ